MWQNMYEKQGHSGYRVAVVNQSQE